jgi:competence protein ComEC
MKITANKTKIKDTSKVFYLKLNGDPKIDGDLLQLMGNEIRYNEKMIIRYQIHSKTEKTMLENKNFYGLVCRIKGELKKPKQAKNENAFDYRKYLNRMGVFWILESGQPPFGNCSLEKVNLFLYLKRLRYSGIKYIENHFPPEVAGLSSALIFGDRNSMDPEVLLDYQKVGIIHLLAISGLHVSLLIGMLYFIGLRCGVTREFMTNFILIILPAYAVLTGGSPSVIRSVLMIFLVMATVKWKSVIKLYPIDAISLAFVLFLFLDSLVLLDIGFQLSFSVSFAIILSAPLILQRYQSSLSKLLATSVIAQFSVLPFLLFHFFGASMISIFANLIFIPLFSYILMPSVYLLFLFHLLFGMIPVPIMNLFSKLIHLSSITSNLFSHFSFAEIVPGRPNYFFLILYAVTIVIIFFTWEKKRSPRKIKIILILGFFLFTFQVEWNRINPVGEVTFIDVGQGDSILIHLPYGKGNYLIDTGGSLQFNVSQWQIKSNPFEVGQDVVVPYLKGKGITTIDKLILTHGDMDHIGGTFSILKELTVKQVLMPSVAEPSNTELAISDEAKKKRIPVVHVSDGDFWKNNESYFHILSPEKNFKGVRNRGSIVLYAEIGGLTWFFGGDLDQEGEEEVIKRYPGLSFDVLKVGHHGSKTSSSEIFLKQCKPKISVLSVGEKNRYGHPNQEVLEALNKIHSTIYRTDTEGGITYRFYFGKGTFSSFLP